MDGNSPWLYMSSSLSLTLLSLRLHCIDGWRNRLITSNLLPDEQEVNGTHQPPHACETSFTDPQTDLFLPLKWTHFLPFLPATWTFMKVEKEQVHLFLSKEAALIVPEGPVYYQRLVTAVHTCGGVGGSVETNVECRTQHMVNSKLPNWTVTFSQAELILFAGPEAA